MKKYFHYILIGLVLVTLPACNTTNSNQKEIMASGGQVQLRSYQTRTYDTDDKIRVLRAVVATLQDLGFVLDKADDVIGIVSATKLDRSKSSYQFYRLSMSISVRPRGDQMMVRANAQFNLTAIEDPGPYQDFFTSLDKGIFLDNNLLADTVPAQKASSIAAAAAEAESTYEFYGRAEKEIVSGTYDTNLWARALVEVEGDEQKRRARYIELRADQLYYQNAASSSNTTPTARSIVNSQPTGSIQPVVPVIVKPSNPADDISGTWVSEITTNSPWTFPKKRHRNLVIDILQDGDMITGTSDSIDFDLTGSRRGDTIKFDLWAFDISSSVLTGKWKLSADGSKLEGNWNTGSADGKWSLTKIQNYSATATSLQSTSPVQVDQSESVLDISGTYESRITSNNRDHFTKKYRALVLEIKQDGNDITAIDSDLKVKIYGTRIGDTITFSVEPGRASDFQDATGTWKILADGSRFEGSWEIRGYNASGKWDLSKIQ